MEHKSDWLTQDGHLNDEACALWVDALNERNVVTLPDEVLQHAKTCIECKKKILNVKTILAYTIDPQLNEQKNLKARFQRTFSRKQYMLAAVILFFLTIGSSLLYFYIRQPENADSLFAENFIPYPDIITNKGISAFSFRDSLLAEGLNAYALENYSMAIKNFDPLYSVEPDNDTLGFYLANAILASGKNIEVAIPILRKICVGKSLLSEPAKWYLALSLIKINDYKSAGYTLQQIILESGSYKQNAEQVIKKIN